jgi:acyl-CoA synthetase (AMP-forming)/AMP-acid ligase II
MAYQVGDLFEHVVDVVPERTALICGADQRTFAELEARANRLAHHLQAHGVGKDDHVGIYGPNSVEWVEAMLACFKIRAVPVNINYRYVTEELRYLFDNADLKAIVYEEEYGPRIAAVRDQLPLLRHAIKMDRGLGTDQAGLEHVAFEDAVASGSPERDFEERSSDDRVIIYTGGTTGMPKGVMWRSEDIFYALAGGIDPFTKQPVASEYEQSEKAAAGGQLIFMNIPPLMHGAAFVSTMMQAFQGNVNVLIRKFDPADVWRQVAEHRVNSILIAGDAIGRPLIEALTELEADGVELDLSCLISLSSSAAVFSPTVKDAFLERFPNLVLTDSIGATESGFTGLVTVGKGNTAMKGGGPTVAPGKDAVVLDDDLGFVEPGSGVIGKVARGGNIALGYYKDEAKTAETFVIAADGKRYSIPGDFATVEADGSITLLGRGSVCINSGGEKVYPEEVESALKAHPDVFDAVVVGVPDPRWGSRVAAVVQARPGAEPTLADLDAHCREYIAGYKVPRELHLVDEIVRSPAGKPDYPWAKRLAEAAGDQKLAGASGQ